MKHSLAVILLILASFVFVLAQSQSQDSPIQPKTDAQRAANVELHAAAKAYVAGKFAEAQRLSERALEIDPSNKIAPFFIARAIHSQYQPNIENPENIAKAREAIAAYQKLLPLSPDNDEAYKAIAALYGAIGEDELQYSWILQRAVNGAVAADKRAEAYAILASKDWDCSYTITEGSEFKRVSRTKSGDQIIVFRMPKDQTEFNKAHECATRGLDMVEMAITLDPENDAAWSFKNNLLLEMAKFAEMDGNNNRKTAYKRLASEAEKRTNEITLKHQRELDEANPETCAALDSGDANTVSSRLLNGVAISKPQPPFPSIAKTARAHGAVVVQVSVDEEGNVDSAAAVSGHPLLRAAAVQAARQAKFLPTFVAGQPTKVTGMLCYDFGLPVIQTDTSNQ